MAWRQRVVVVGAGFGGLAVARALREENLDVLVLDRTNHHVFQPLLYQVATCALSPAEIATPIRSILRGQKNAEVVFTEVSSVNLAARRLETSTGPIDYHFLVLAAGALPNYFGHDDWAKTARGLKTIDDAVELRRRVLIALEVAEQETLAQRRRELLTFCVIGGGPTGVELAGALSELSRRMVRRDFRHIRPGDISIVLVEGSHAVLSSFSERSQRRALRQLERLGVEIRHRSRVIGVEENALLVSTEHGAAERIPASTVLWAAGVRGSELSTTLGVPLDRSGRVIVDSSLTLPGYDEVFCIGDMAACTDASGKPVPGIAPAAMQQGRYVARRITARSQHGTPGFRYRNKGQLATIGRSAAVAEFGWLALSGFVAWVLWLVVHVCFLVGFRNRYLVLSQWVWHYFTYQGGARLITGPRDGSITWPAQPRRLARPPKLVSALSSPVPETGRSGQP
jgi:NADH:ubiquinone reductase (H+-translocating)